MKKLEKAIRDSFSFPEPERKDEFFAKAETVSGNEEITRRRKTIVYKLTAAAAACAAAFGIWSGLKYASVGNKPDFRGDTVITEPAQTSETATADNGTAVQTEQTTATAVTTSASATALTVTTAETASAASASTALTAVTTASQTNARVTTTLNTITQPVTTTDIIVPETRLDDSERSYIMKKVVSYTAALAMMSTSIPTGTAAKFIPKEPTSGQSAIYSSIDAGNISVDFNADGKFDISDVYMLHNATTHYDIIPDSIAEYFTKNGDINGDGTTDSTDSDALIGYYVYKNGAPAKLFSAENYKNAKGEVTAGSYAFVQDLMTEAENYNYLYGYIEEKIDAGNYDIDLNSDGEINGEDAFDYYLYSYSLSFMPYTEGIGVSGKNSVIGSDIWAKCEKLNGALKADDLCTFDYSSEQISKYIFYKNGVTTDDISLNNYRTLLNSFPNAGHILENGEFTQIASDRIFEGTYLVNYYGKAADFYTAIVKDIAVNSGMATVEDKRDKALMMVDGDYFDQKFKEYDEGIAAGEIAPPDVDGNGHCNKNDYGALDVYYTDLIQMRSAEESTLDPDIWNYIDTQFDLDGNGISGDVYDIYLAMQFLIKYEDSYAEVDKLLAAYNKNKAAEAEREASVISKNEITYLAGLNVARSGDANDDGQVNMADAVMIMQSVTNPDKYQLSDWGEFNADICNTGDGVTQMDACRIQKDILGIN